MQRAEFPWRQFPPDLDLYNVTAVGDWLERVADPRVASWPLMGSIWPTVYLCLAYMASVLILAPIMRSVRPAPKEGEKKKPDPFDWWVKPIMILYNAGVIMANFYLFVSFIGQYFLCGMKPICNAVDYSEKGHHLATLIYIFYVSKAVDFCDTYFMLLRRNYRQVTFLHVYHHALMLPIWWLGTKYVAGGDAIWGPMINSFVHVIMYSYYLAALLKIQLKGKQLITQLQMLQFVVIMTHSFFVIYLDCPFPHWCHYAQIVFLISLFWLFSNFYRQSYRKKQAEAKKRN